ncbi:ABC transporter ATP-binding protein [Variovorax sp. M-6]|uniref:ABC transporter ATP-binding protein n=1 Tax=Variovorax sp. M-6 TaxID=3233041 RepID=UPI003F9C9D7A
MSAATLLRFSNLHAGYNTEPIIRGATEQVRHGEIITIIGPNGAGKSTLLRAIFGELHHMSGSISFMDTDVSGLPSTRRQRMGIGFVPQGRCNFPLMTVQENLLLGTHALPRAERQRAIDRMMTLFPMLRKRVRVLAGNLSGGEQQVLEMAMVLETGPKLLLLDEPSLGLSPKTMGEVFDTIEQIRADGITVLIVEQNTAGALAISDRAWVLELGTLIASGTASEIANDSRIRRAYLGAENA